MRRGTRRPGLFGLQERAHGGQKPWVLDSRTRIADQHWTAARVVVAVPLVGAAVAALTSMNDGLYRLLVKEDAILEAKSLLTELLWQSLPPLCMAIGVRQT